MTLMSTLVNLVKQIPYLFILCTFQDLIHGVVRVTASDSILLHVAEVNVRGEQDLKCILVIPGRKTPESLT